MLGGSFLHAERFRRSGVDDDRRIVFRKQRGRRHDTGYEGGDRGRSGEGDWGEQVAMITGSPLRPFGQDSGHHHTYAR